MVFVFLFLTYYFIQYDNLQLHPCCFKWQYFILFMTNIPLCMYILICIYIHVYMCIVCIYIYIYFFFVVVAVVVLQSFSHVQLFCNPMDYSPPGSSVHDVFQARILEWVPISSSRGYSQPRDLINPHLLHWQADSLPLSHQGSPLNTRAFLISLLCLPAARLGTAPGAQLSQCQIRTE